EIISKQKLGNTMPYIKLGMLKGFKIPLPPLNVQRKIIKQIKVKEKIVKRAKTIIEDAKKQISKILSEV
ncbi:restriction endonuclease subunit S, partial [Patescibacteria group bacterium]|nr:restriction endonuclease subunit S [Patescibacteria group bacterium]